MLLPYKKAVFVIIHNTERQEFKNGQVFCYCVLLCFVALLKIPHKII